MDILATVGTDDATPHRSKIRLQVTNCLTGRIDEVKSHHRFLIARYDSDLGRPLVWSTSSRELLKNGNSLVIANQRPIPVVEVALQIYFWGAVPFLCSG